MTDTRDESANSLFEQAAAWYFRLQAEDVQACERAAFKAWLARGPAQVDAWREATALMGALQEPARTLQRRERGAERWSLLAGHRRWASAAAVLLAIGWFALQSPRVEDWRADYHTAVGELRQIQLADGSTLHLNTNSAVRVRLDAGQREVQLLRGEAWFDVQPDAGRSFVVVSGRGWVRVVGTRFSVAEQGQGARVQVEQGEVEVADGRGATAYLLPGERLDYGRSGLSEVTHFDPTAAFAWRQRQLVFQQQPLGEVIAELQRYQPGLILLRGDGLRDQVVSGVFDIDKPEAVIKALEHIIGLQAVRYGPYLLVLRSS